MIRANHLLGAGLLTLGTALALAAPAAAEDVKYRVIDLGPSFVPTALGEDGTVVGATPNDIAPVVWRNGRFAPLPEGSLSYCRINDINATGLAGGFCTGGGARTTVAATWTIPPGGAITGPVALPFLPGDRVSSFQVRSVATDGTLVGSFFEYGPPRGVGVPPLDASRAALWPAGGGALRRLDGTAFGEGDDASAFGVNARGTVVGFQAEDDGTPVASGRRWTVSSGGVARVDGDPQVAGSSVRCQSHPINDAGQIAGRRNNRTTDGMIRFVDGTEVSTGPFLPVAINQAGTTVGVRADGSGTIVGVPQGKAAIRAIGGTVSDLQDLLAEPSPITLTDACDLNERGEIIGVGKVGNERRSFLLTPAEPTLSVALTAPVPASGDLLGVRLTATNSAASPLTDVAFTSGMGVARDDTAGGTPLGLGSLFGPAPGFAATIAPQASVTHDVSFEVTAPGTTRLVTRVKAKDANGATQTVDAALRVDATLRPMSQWETRQAVAGMFTKLAAKAQEARARNVKRLVDAVRKDLQRNPKTRGLLKPTAYEKALAQRSGLPANALSFLPNVIRRDGDTRRSIVPRKPTAAELTTIFVAEGSERFLRTVDKALDGVADKTLITPGLFWRDYLRGVWNGQEGAINAEIADAASETWTKGTGALAQTGKFWGSEEERKYLLAELPKIYDEAAAKVDAYRVKTEFDLIKWDDLMQSDPRKAVKIFAGKLGDVEGFVAGAAIDDLFDPVGNAQKALGALRRGAKAGDLADVVDAVTPPGAVEQRLVQGGASRIVKNGTAPVRTPIPGMGNLNDDQLDFLSTTAKKVNTKFGIDIEIQARPVNAYSANIKDGIGKVEAVPTKNLTPDDVLMGAPQEWLGQTAYYKPKLPPGFAKLKDVDKKRVQLRYDEKLKEYKQFKGTLDDPTGKADKVKKMLKPGGADVDLGQNYKGKIELAAVEKGGATLIQYKKLVVNGKPVFTGRPRPIVSDIDFNAVVDRLSGKNLPASIRGAVELELMNEFSKAQHSGLIPFGFHGWTHSGFDAKAKDFRNIAKYMLMYATDEQALRYARRWAPEFFPELGKIADPRKYEREYRKAVEAILDGYTRNKHLVKVTAEGATIGPGVDPTIGLPLP